MKLLLSEKAINKQYLKQDFHPHTKGNGQIVMVSDDFQYYYYPKY